MTQPEIEGALVTLGLVPGPAGLWTDEASGVGVVVGESGVFVGWLDVAWDGPSAPQPWLRDVAHLVPAAITRDLRREHERAAVARQAASRTCRLCGLAKTPGWMHEQDVCQSCAERRLGVLH